MNNDEIISTLNGLIETCKDGEESYKACVSDAIARQSPLQTMFADLQHGCENAAIELQHLVRTAGGEACTDSRVGSTIHRNWIHLKAAIVGENDKTALIECEREEDSAKEKYGAALEQNLPAEIRTIVERQYQGVLVNHDQIKNLRDHVKPSV